MSDRTYMPSGTWPIFPYESIEFPADPDSRTVSQLNETQQMSYQDQLMVMAIKMLDAMEMARTIRYFLRY